MGTEVQLRCCIRLKVITLQVRRPLQIELPQRLFTGAADMCTKLAARTDTKVLPAHFAKWGIDGTEEVHDCVRAHALNQGSEIEELLVGSYLVGVFPVVREGCSLIDAGAELYCS